jgi:hypothetical protein
VVAYLGLLLLLYVLLPAFIHRRQFDQAISDWRANISPNNEVVLHTEQRENTIIQLKLAATGALALWAAGLAGYAIAHGVRR